MTISELIDVSKKNFDRDGILTLIFLDMEGVQISGSVKASMLYRLDKFKISINRGEKVYNCYNFNYLANKKLDLNIEIFSNDFYDAIEKDMHKNQLPFNISYIMNKCARKDYLHEEEKLTYKKLFENILSDKYFPLQKFHYKQMVEKDRRLWKFLNFYFYLTLFQTILMNSCVFVFFSWDFMEPITQCISYMNLIVGYYYWCVTNGGDYEISSISAFLKSRSLFTKNIDNALKEKLELENFLNEKDEDEEEKL
jgi:hypothetical protein